MSESDRANTEYFPQYLQVLQATDTQEEVWAGLSGKIVTEILKLEDHVNESERGLRQEIQDLQASLEAKVEANAKVGGRGTAEVKAEVAELKEMIEEQAKQASRIEKLLTAIAPPPEPEPDPEAEAEPEPEPQPQPQPEPEPEPEPEP